MHRYTTIAAVFAVVIAAGGTVSLVAPTYIASGVSALVAIAGFRLLEATDESDS